MTLPRARARRRRALPTVFLLLVALVTGCGNSSGRTAADDAGTTAATGDPAASPTTAATPSTTSTPTTAAVVTATTAVSTSPSTTAATGTVIEASFAGGEVLVETERFEVALGEEVSIVVTSDVVEHVHLHGYDLLADVAPGVPGRIDFVADVPGVFEVELEDTHLFLFEIAVS